jgi:hypothetical protein
MRVIRARRHETLVSTYQSVTFRAGKDYEGERGTHSVLNRCYTILIPRNRITVQHSNIELEEK